MADDLGQRKIVAKFVIPVLPRNAAITGLTATHQSGLEQGVVGVIDVPQGVFAFGLY